MVTPRNPDAKHSVEAIKERRKVVAELSREGFTLREIAVRLGCTERTVVRDKEELHLSRPRPRLSNEERRRAEELLCDGYSLEEVARTLRRHVHTIGRYYKGRGWTREEVGQYNAMRHLEKRVLGGD